MDAYPKAFSLSFVDDDDEASGLFAKINPATQEPLSQLDPEFEFEENFSQSQASQSQPVSYFDGDVGSENGDASVLSVLETELNFQEEDYVEDNLPSYACR